MISEKQLAKLAGFWTRVAPLIEGFVRLVNSDLIVAEYDELESVVPPTRRAFVNELAYDIYCDHRDTLEIGELPLAALAKNVALRLARLDGLPPPPDGAGVDLTEAREAVDLSSRLRQIVSTIGGDVVVRPTFRGCGFLSEATADLIVGDCLVEVKAGKRSFRGEDVRQVLAYLALNHAAQGIAIERVALVNPRMGTYTILSVSTLALRVATTSHDELFNRIIYALTSGTPSR